MPTAADEPQSIDPRYFARRVEPGFDEDRSITPRHFAPITGPPGRVPGIASTLVTPGARSGEAPDPNQTVEFGSLRCQKLAILAEQAAGWIVGRPAAPEDLLSRWPVDPSTDPDAASLMVEDFFRRRRRGDDASLNEYEERFPEHSRSIASLVSRHHAFGNLETTGPGQATALQLPDVGNEIFGFRLTRALGKGAFARVFLAHQGELAGRPVVLKVSAIEGIEPQTLAQLQHTNIVPIYSVHEDAGSGLRAVCMPYFGGASLSEVLKRVFAIDSVPGKGRDFVEALEIVQAPPPDQAGGLVEAEAECRTPLSALAGSDYPRVVTWLAARLAEGLQHAHQRGVLHRDIKPANILISAEGQPLLLDFNLAHDLNADPVHATIGGTIAYMAPEHLLAILRQSPEQAGRVDHRSDIYSLGMVMAEMLTGHNPFEQSASYSAFPLQIEAMALDRARQTPSIKASRPDVSWGLESVIQTCLNADPDRRYQRAEHLAEDLRRLLDDRPLRFAPEPSLRERCRKFVRRNPRLITAATVTAVASVAILAMAWAFAGVSRHLVSTRDRLGVFQTRDRLEAHDKGTSEALTLVNSVIERGDLLRRGLAACEKTLQLYDPAPGSSGSGHPDLTKLGPEDRRRVLEDRRELLLLSAGARVLLAPGDRQALREALARLDRAEGLPGLEPSKALANDRARYLSLLGDEPGAKAAQLRADRTPARSARDYYLLATSHARRGDRAGYDRAIDELNRALRINPRHYWSLVLRGVCSLEKGDHVSAAGDFGLCAGLRPDLPWGYFNRGYVLDQSGRKAEAIEDYTAAIARDPGFAPARINRGMALLQRGRHAEALADFEAASSATGGGDATLSAGRGMALEGLGRHVEADASFARAFAGPKPPSGGERSRLLWAYGFAVSARLPERAIDAFEEVLTGDPDQPQARYGLAMLAMARGLLDQAIDHFDRAIHASPDFAEARRYRAVAEARSASWDKAGLDIRWCLDRDPGSGEALYAAACVSSLAAGKLRSPETARQSLELLKRALDRGAGLERFAADPDLASIRDRPEFAQLVGRHRPGPARTATP